MYVHKYNTQYSHPLTTKTYSKLSFSLDDDFGLHTYNTSSSYIILGLVLEYCSRCSADILNISVFNALSIGSGLIAAVLLCIQRGRYLFFTHDESKRPVLRSII